MHIRMLYISVIYIELSIFGLSCRTSESRRWLSIRCGAA